MSNTPYNDYLNKRIDEIHDEIVALRPFEMLMVWVDERHRIVSETQYAMPSFLPSKLSVADVADVEIDSQGVSDG